MKIQFYIDERKNRFAKQGKEWAVDVSLDGHAYTIIAFEKKPTAGDVEKIKEIIMRSMEVYHRHIKIPCFEMLETK